MILRDIAHARAGDKGDISTLSLFVYDTKDFALLEEKITHQALKNHLKSRVKGKIERYELPQLGALHFVLHEALNGGVTRSLALDAHGKSLSSLVLEMRI
jgi:hypothetical protein